MQLPYALLVLMMDIVGEEFLPHIAFRNSPFLSVFGYSLLGIKSEVMNVEKEKTNTSFLMALTMTNLSGLISASALVLFCCAAAACGC